MRVLAVRVEERPLAAVLVDEVQIFQVEEVRTYPAWWERTDPRGNS